MRSEMVAVRLVLRGAREMNRLMLAVAFIGLTTPALAAPPAEEARIIAAAKAAFEKKDPKLLETITYWEGATPEVRDDVKRFYAGTIKNVQIKGVSIAPENPADQTDHSFVSNGVKHVPNLKVQYQLVLSLKNGGVSQMAMGEHAGKLYLVVNVPAK
jgi:hypothetical protein